jgi:ubiquinone biosynthesis monooxygenase Coq7
MDLDRLLASADNALKTVSGASHAGRPRPRGTTAAEHEPELTGDERRLSGALMRVNHVGEVCAQALYQAQALAAGSEDLRQRMLRAATEETDHLAWTQARLTELRDRPSLLVPLWYAGAFAIGLVAARMGDRTSLGFLVETERQVEQHLAGHLERLPAADASSRAIVEQMKTDESRHAESAQDAGAQPLPLPMRIAMKLAARVMTVTAFRI